MLTAKNAQIAKIDPDYRIAQCAGELACLTVHPNYRSAGCGDALLKAIEAKARSQGSKKLFVLTTRTAHWFIERGFLGADVSQLPGAKQGLYNYQRRSKVFMKPL